MWGKRGKRLKRVRLGCHRDAEGRDTRSECEGLNEGRARVYRRSIERSRRTRGQGGYRPLRTQSKTPIVSCANQISTLKRDLKPCVGTPNMASCKRPSRRGGVGGGMNLPCTKLASFSCGTRDDRQMPAVLPRIKPALQGPSRCSVLVRGPLQRPGYQLRAPSPLGPHPRRPHAAQPQRQQPRRFPAPPPPPPAAAFPRATAAAAPPSAPASPSSPAPPPPSPSPPPPPSPVPPPVPAPPPP
jgi:hypothetical protein